MYEKTPHSALEELEFGSLETRILLYIYIDIYINIFAFKHIYIHTYIQIFPLVIGVYVNSHSNLNL